MQQWRLFPFLAGAYALKIFSDALFKDYITFLMNQYSSAGGNPNDSREKADLKALKLALAGGEIHALSSSAKPLAGWLARDAIQESREACGGHGYLRATGLGQLRDDNDANCTYEGNGHD